MRVKPRWFMGLVTRYAMPSVYGLIPGSSPGLNLWSNAVAFVGACTQATFTHLQSTDRVTTLNEIAIGEGKEKVSTNYRIYFILFLNLHH